MNHPVRRAATRRAGALLMAAGAATIAGVLPLLADGLGAPRLGATALAAPPPASTALSAFVGPRAAAPPPALGPAVPLALGPRAPEPVGPRVLAARAALPVGLSLPSLGVTAALEHVGARPDGSMQAPAGFDSAAWYSPGPAPGEAGAAVIAGHVDSYRGPAVFFRLRELAPGDPVLVRRADGSTATFVVTRTERVRKDAFPTERVFGDVRRPELRLITCAGRFDRSRRSYTDNLVVHAVLAPSVRAA